MNNKNTDDPKRRRHKMVAKVIFILSLFFFFIVIIGIILANNEYLALYSSSKFFDIISYVTIISVILAVVGFSISSNINAVIREGEQRRLYWSQFKKCPFCAEWVKVEAIVCMHCGRDFEKEKY